MSSHDYVKKNLREIFNTNKNEKIKSFALSSCWLIANQKGFNLKAYDVKQNSSLADYYVVASTQNIVQSQAIADSITRNLKEFTDCQIKIEGYESGDWILIDLTDVIIHLFLENTREIFDLDNLWNSYPQIEIPEEYYFNNVESTKTEDTKGYF